MVVIHPFQEAGSPLINARLFQVMKLMGDSVSEMAEIVAAFEGKRNGGAKRETVVV